MFESGRLSEPRRSGTVGFEVRTKNFLAFALRELKSALRATSASVAAPQEKTREICLGRYFMASRF